MSIVWLASYPKSGNTWMRAFLTNYLHDSEVPADINALERTPIASSRSLFDRYSGLKSSDLTHEEVDSYRPDIYRQIAAANQTPFFMKVHDSYRFLPDGQALFPASATQAAIYILRNPLDVAVSGVAHFNLDCIDRAVEGMGLDAAMCDEKRSLAGQLRQHLGTWSGHVVSWTCNAKGFPVLAVRYEDMLLRPLETFAQVVQTAGLPLEQRRLEKAIDFSRFESLRQQEAEHGFCEAASRTTGFFREGKSGDWTNHLSRQQVRKITGDHGEVMRRFGYLTVTGDIVFGATTALTECE